MKWIAVVSVLLTGARQDPPAPPEKKGLHVETGGMGFLPMVEVPNAIPLTATDPESKRYLSRMGAWTPLAVTFDNYGDALSGTLTARSTWPENRTPVVYHKRIRIGGHGKSRVSIPVMDDSIYAFRISFDDDKLGSVPIAGAREFEIGRPRTQGVNTRLVLVATTQQTNFVHFLHRNSTSQLLTDRMILPVETRSLPATAMEYEPIDAVILDDVPLEELSGAQVAALHEWVCRGGTLVTCLIRSASRPVPPALQPLLPGEPIGIENRSEFEELRNATGVTCRLTPSLAVMTFRPKPGATAWNDASPVIVHAPCEMGMTICLGFPITSRFLQTWHGGARLFDTLIEFERRAQVPIAVTNSLHELRSQMAKALKGSIAKSLPPFRTVMLLILIYGAAVIVLPYAGFRPFKRLEYAWALVLVLALGGSAVIYGVGAQYLKTNSSVYRVTVVEGGAVGGPHTRHNFWCAFTAKSDRIDLAFDRPSVVFPFGTELALRGASADEAMQSWYESDLHVQGLRTYAQDSVLFETTDTETLAGRLEFQAAVAESELKITLAARDGFALKQAWVGWRDKIAEVMPGSSAVGWLDTGVPEIDGSVVRRRAFQALAHEAMRQSRVLGRPVLLYETHGEAGLQKPLLSEDHLHFGFLAAAESELPATSSEWTTRRLTPPPGDEGDPDQPVEYVMTIVTGELITAVQLPDWRDDRIGVEFFNVRTQGWDRMQLGFDVKADAYVTYGKLGRAFIRARLVGRGVGLRSQFPKITSR